MSKRGARFEILDDDQHDENADWVVLDIPPALLNQVFEKLQTWKLLESENKFEPNSLLTVHLHVKASHPKTIGPNKSDNSPPDIGYLPSLLSIDIPKSDASFKDEAILDLMRNILIENKVLNEALTHVQRRSTELIQKARAFRNKIIELGGQDPGLP
jgi:hypothetical protein